MRTYLDCIPCFYRQALDAARIAGTDEIKQKQIVDKISQLIPDFPLEASPPEMGRVIHSLVGKISGVKDPFKGIKENSNKFALKLYPKLKQEINNSEDRLLTAVKLSIIGNIIDYGAKNSLNVVEEIDYLFQGNFMINNENNSTTFKYNQFKETLNKVDTIIYLADNAGEVVFDRLLIEELVKELGKEVIYVVKEKPIINDALIKDAIFCGINEVAKIISSGSDAPGTLLKYCSGEFIRLYQKAELIISKGQGNYESLSEEDKSIFFLFRAKCPVIAEDVGCKVGDMVLVGR
ncbi:MAG: ARMT1-like domain-containing protein [Candidatus Caldatribacteriota bacterium]|nr:ARMT1-like domain-containing protein [Candidatus Caldatribacteriota bacterium]